MADDYDGFGGPYSNITPEYVDKYMSSKNVPELWSDETAADYRKGYGAGWAGIPGDMLNALTAWAVSGIPDPLLREQARTSLHIPGTDDIGRSMDADVESAAFQTGAIGLPGLDDIFLKTPWLATALFASVRKAKPKKNLIDAIYTIDPIGGWKSLDVDATMKLLPPVEDGNTRLFRAEGGKYEHDEVWKPGTIQTSNPNNLPGEFYTKDINYADYYRETYGAGSELKYIDVPTESLKRLESPKFPGEYIVESEDWAPSKLEKVMEIVDKY